MSTDITNESSLGAVGTHLGPNAALPGIGSTGGSTTAPDSRRQRLDSSMIGDPAETGAIEFRVSRENESRRRLRLTGHRYTFGNADGCTIRLNDPDLRPMHAVLTREGAKIVVRSYSVPVNVNEVEVSEATLQVGDVLRIGLYDFELLGLTEPNRSPSPRPPFAAPSGNVAAARRDLPSADDVVWRERLRREVEQWRQRQEDCDRRESRIDDREAELRTRESELWSRSDNLHRRESRVQSQEAETFQLYDVFAQRQQELLQLREESEHRQEALRRREIEFREQEFEYRRRLNEATAQLDQSKLQADSATQAVTRMREQFDALNAQIEALSKDQQEIEAREVEQSENYRQRTEELEEARAEAQRQQSEAEQRQADATQGQAESERQRAEAEARVAELESELASIRSAGDGDFHQQHAELLESKRVAEQLRDQVGELQQAVQDATEESEHLKTEFEQSSAKVNELEQLVAQSQQRGDENRDQWATETEQLRADVERLSNDLSEANSQLAEVRDANQALNERLSDIRQERDDARVERDARPTTDAFQALREELEAANDQLHEIKQLYDESLTKLSSEDSSASSDVIPAALGLTADLDESESSESDHSASLVDTQVAEPSDAVNDVDDDPWPTYQSSLSDPATVESGTDSELGEPNAAFPAENESPGPASIWRSPTLPTESPTSEDLAADIATADDQVWQSDATEPESSQTWGSQSDQAIEQNQSDDLVNEVATDLDDDGDELSSDPGWAESEATDHVGSDNDWKTPVEEVVEPTPDWQSDVDPEASDPQSFSDDAIDAEADAAAPSDHSANWARPEPESAEPSEPETISSALGALWKSASEDASDSDDAASSEDSTNMNGDESLISGSLANALIEDFRNESAAQEESAVQNLDDAQEHPQVETSGDSSSIDSETEFKGRDRDADSDPMEEPQSEPRDFSQQDDQNVEGTFVMSDHLGAPSWSAASDLAVPDLAVPDLAVPDLAVPEGAVPSFAELNDQANDQDASPWNEVNEHEHEFLNSDNDQPEQSDDLGEMRLEDSSEVYVGNDDALSSDESEFDDHQDSVEIPGDPSSEMLGSDSGESPIETDQTSSEFAPQDDDSIEAYMNRLLRRVQGEGESSEDAAMPETISVSTSQSNLAPEPSLSQSVATESAELPVEPIDINAPLVPRSQAPERGGNLNAMRDLANSSARSAISRSARVQSRDTQIQAMVSFACAAGALACNAFAFYFLGGVLLMIAVSMTFVVALICVREGIHLLGEAKRRVQTGSANETITVAEEVTESN